MKRIISLLLVLTMVLSVLPNMVFASEPDDEVLAGGTATDQELQPMSEGTDDNLTVKVVDFGYGTTPKAAFNTATRVNQMLLTRRDENYPDKVFWNGNLAESYGQKLSPIRNEVLYLTIETLPKDVNVDVWVQPPAVNGKEAKPFAFPVKGNGSGPNNTDGRSYTTYFLSLNNMTIPGWRIHGGEWKIVKVTAYDSKKYDSLEIGKLALSDSAYAKSTGVTTDGAGLKKTFTPIALAISEKAETQSVEITYPTARAGETEAEKQIVKISAKVTNIKPTLADKEGDPNETYAYWVGIGVVAPEGATKRTVVSYVIDEERAEGVSKEEQEALQRGEALKVLNKAPGADTAKYTLEEENDLDIITTGAASGAPQQGYTAWIPADKFSGQDRCCALIKWEDDNGKEIDTVFYQFELKEVTRAPYETKVVAAPLSADAKVTENTAVFTGITTHHAQRLGDIDVNEVTIDVKDLHKHLNGENQEGHWVGVSFVPTMSDLDGVLPGGCFYAVFNSLSQGLEGLQKIGPVKPLEKNVDGLGHDGVAFYFDAGAEDTTFDKWIALEWDGADDLLLYHVTFNVTCAYDLKITDGQFASEGQIMAKDPSLTFAPDENMYVELAKPIPEGKNVWLVVTQPDGTAAWKIQYLKSQAGKTLLHWEASHTGRYIDDSYAPAGDYTAYVVLYDEGQKPWDEFNALKQGTVAEKIAELGYEYDSRVITKPYTLPIKASGIYETYSEFFKAFGANHPAIVDAQNSTDIFYLQLREPLPEDQHYVRIVLVDENGNYTHWIAAETAGADLLYWTIDQVDSGVKDMEELYGGRYKMLAVLSDTPFTNAEAENGKLAKDEDDLIAEFGEPKVSVGRSFKIYRTYTTTVMNAPVSDPYAKYGEIKQSADGKTIDVTITDLHKHANGEDPAKEGHWAGVSFIPSSESERVAYRIGLFGKDNIIPVESAVDGKDAKGLALYFDLPEGDTTKTVLVQWENQHGATTYTIKFHVTYAKEYEEDLYAAPLGEGANTTEYKLDGAGTEYTLTATDLHKHNSDGQGEGYWAGVSFVPKHDAKKVTFSIDGAAEKTIDVEPNVYDGKSGLAVYFNVKEDEPAHKIAIKWDDETIARTYTINFNVKYPYVLSVKDSGYLTKEALEAKYPNIKDAAANNFYLELAEKMPAGKNLWLVLADENDEFAGHMQFNKGGSVIYWNAETMGDMSTTPLDPGKYTIYAVLFDESESPWNDFDDADGVKAGVEALELPTATGTATIPEPEHVHAWNDVPTVQWADDFASVTITYSCDSCHETYTPDDVKITSETRKATCEADGLTTYTATYTDPNGEQKTATTTKKLDKLGHKWGTEPEFKWSNDGTTVTEVVFTCANDNTHKHTITANDVKLTSEQIKAPTCEAAGETTYTAEVTFNGQTYKSENNVATPAAKGHAYGDPEFTWSADGKTATAKVTCANDATHTQDVDVTMSSAVKTPATDTEMGTMTYTATANWNGQTYTATNDVKDIPAKGHTYGEPKFQWTDDGNVTVTADCINDDSATWTADPDDVTVTSEQTKAPTETEPGEMTYKATVTGPDGKTYTSEKKVEIPATGHICQSEPFEDVDQSSWYHEGVDFMIENGYMNGITNTTFKPERTLNRAMMVTILYRMAGSPTISGVTPFTDVVAGSYYEQAVAWAYAEGVVKGVTETLFRPNADITREQLAAMLMRYAAYKEIDTSARVDLDKYSDKAMVSAYATEPMQWAIATGIIEGREPDMVVPKGTTKRDEAAVMCMRFVQNVEQ